MLRKQKLGEVHFVRTLYLFPVLLYTVILPGLKPKDKLLTLIVDLPLLNFFILTLCTTLSITGIDILRFSFSVSLQIFK